jgi:hypothetical protein
MSSNSDYVSKAKISTIHATSRVSCKIRDNFYTVEYSEERTVPNIKGVDIEMERQLLWDAVNSECDNQVQEILDSFDK